MGTKKCLFYSESLYISIYNYSHDLNFKNPSLPSKIPSSTYELSASIQTTDLYIKSVGYSVKKSILFCYFTHTHHHMHRLGEEWKTKCVGAAPPFALRCAILDFFRFKNKDFNFVI